MLLLKKVILIGSATANEVRIAVVVHLVGSACAAVQLVGAVQVRELLVGLRLGLELRLALGGVALQSAALRLLL